VFHSPRELRQHRLHFVDALVEVIGGFSHQVA
jgi:hypothetical protein